MGDVELDFAWPTMKDLYRMGEDNVRLHSLTFKKVYSDVISSVCCTLTNGETSGTIEDDSIEHEAE